MDQLIHTYESTYYGKKKGNPIHEFKPLIVHLKGLKFNKEKEKRTMLR